MNQLFQWLHTTVQPNQWRWIPGSVTVLLVLGAIKLGVLQSSEHMAYNTFIRLRGKQPWHDDIVIIEIDDKTLSELGQLPLSRDKHTQVLDTLKEAKSSIVVFNLFFADPSSHDEQFAQAILRHGQVVLGHGKPSLSHEQLNQNLYNHAISVGHILNVADSDGITRSIQPYTYLENNQANGHESEHIDDRAFEALGFAAIQVYSPAKALVPMTDISQKFWLNWPDSADGLQRYSFIDVIRISNPQNSGQTTNKVNPIVFKDKIVIIGVSAPGVNPILTPFDYQSPTSGIAVHAAVITNLLYRNHLRPVTSPWNGYIFLLGGPILGIFLSTTEVKHRWTLVGGAIILWLLGAYVLLKINYLVPLVWPVLLITLNAGFTEIGARLAAHTNLQKEVDRLWQAHHQGVLIQGMDDPPSWILLLDKYQSSNNRPSPCSFLTHLFQPIATRSIHRLTTLTELLGQSQFLYGAIARKLKIGLVTTDWDGQICFCSPTAADFMNISIGDSLSDILVPNWISQSTWECHLKQLRQGQSIQWKHYHQEKWFEIILEPLLNDQEKYSNLISSSFPRKNQFYNNQEKYNSFIFSERIQDNTVSRQRSLFSKQVKSQSLTTKKTLFFLSIEDITAYKQIEIEIRNTLAQSNEINVLKSRLISIVSHELRTSLTIIRTSIEMLERQQFRPIKVNKTLVSNDQASNSKKTFQNQYYQSKKYFNHIDQAISTMTHFLENILILGKMESKKLEFKPIHENFIQFCGSIVEEMQTYSARQSRIILNAQEINQPYYFFDPSLVRIILTNLLSNGLKYSGEETFIYLDLECQAEQLIIKVTDQGVGIPIQDQKYLFEEFHRAENVGKISGTGLGLSIVKQCVQLHGGQIFVKSEVDVGSTFIINLPSHV